MAYCKLWLTYCQPPGENSKKGDGTSNEAYIKARGEGFGYPTTSFTVSHCDDDALIADDGDQEARRRWRVTGLDAGPRFAAALAAPGRDWSVQRFEVPSPP